MDVALLVPIPIPTPAKLNLLIQDRSHVKHFILTIKQALYFHFLSILFIFLNKSF